MKAETSGKLAAWLEALAEKVPQKQSDGLTSTELRDKLNVSRQKTMQLLHSLKSAGRLIVSRRLDTDLAGRSSSVPVYSIKGK